MAILSKTRIDGRGEFLFGSAIVGALRSTQTVAHRILVAVLVPRRDGNSLPVDYNYLFCGLEKTNRDFFAAEMTNLFIAVAKKS